MAQRLLYAMCVHLLHPKQATLSAWIGMAIAAAPSCVAMVGEHTSRGSEMQAGEILAEEHARPKVLVIHFDPADETGQWLSERYQWNDVRNLTWQHTSDMYFASGRAIAYDVVAIRTIREFPPMLGEPFTSESYHSCLGLGGSCTNSRRADYEHIIDDQALCREVASGHIDEVWLFGGPGFGLSESRMVGPGAFFVNSNPLPIDNPSSECTRSFILMGFNTQRTHTEMLHNFGHRVDFMLDHYVSNSAPDLDPATASLYMKSRSGIGFAGCGTTHTPPNTTEGKGVETDYRVRATVASLCDSVGPVPNPSASARIFDCHEWDCSEPTYHSWRFKKIPRTIETNWWRHFFPHATWTSGQADVPKSLPPAI